MSDPTQVPSTLDVINVTATVVVAGFAVLQVFLACPERRDRITLAYRTVWAEWNRLMQADQQWQAEDLIKFADAGSLNPAEILPEDWAALNRDLALLGGDASRYGASAHTVATVASTNARFLMRLCDHAPMSTRSQAQAAVLKRLEGKIKFGVKEASLLLEDALSRAPRRLQRHVVNMGSPQSQLGQALAAEFEKLRPGKHWGIVPLPRIWIRWW